MRRRRRTRRTWGGNEWDEGGENSDHPFDIGMQIPEAGWENLALDTNVMLPPAVYPTTNIHNEHLALAQRQHGVPQQGQRLLRGREPSTINHEYLALTAGQHGVPAVMGRASHPGQGPLTTLGRVHPAGRAKRKFLLLLIGIIIGLLLGWKLALHQHARSAAILAEQNQEREQYIRESLGGACERSEAYKAGWKAAAESPRRKDVSTPQYAFSLGPFFS